MTFCKTRLALAALSVALLAACGDSGPSEFNAAGMNQDISQLSGLEANTFDQAFNGLDDVLGGEPVVAARIGHLVSRPLTGADLRNAKSIINASLVRPVINASSAIPPEVAGKTWVYNENTGHYEVSDQAGAPANGVRILVYEEDINGNIITPLVETGHLDLTDLSSGATRKGRLQLVVSSSTLIDYTVTVTGDDTNGKVTVGGYLVFPTGRLNVDFSAQASMNGNTNTLDISSSLDFPARNLSFDFGINGSVDTVAKTGAASVTETIKSSNGRMDLVGSAGYNDDLSGTIKVNGTTWATFADGTLTPVDGRTLTGAETQALQGAMGLTFLGLFLPVTLVTIMAVLVGALPPIGF